MMAEDEVVDLGLEGGEESLFRAMLLESDLAVVNLLDDPMMDFPFVDAFKALQAEAARSEWGVSLFVLGEIVSTFIDHLGQVYVERYGAPEVSEEAEEDPEADDSQAAPAPN